MPVSDCKHAAVMTRLAADIRIANLCCIRFLLEQARTLPSDSGASAVPVFGISFSRARPVAVDARFVRAHPDRRHPDAQRCAGLAGRQPRRAPRGRHRRPRPRAVSRPANGRAARVGLRARRGRALGHDFSARDGTPADRAHPFDASRGVHRRRRGRPQTPAPPAGGSCPLRQLERPRRGGADVFHARRRGARAVFIVDDNITLDVERFRVLCEAIIDAGLTDIDYLVQGMTSAIAAHGEELAPLMRRAGFRYVFLGIENILDDDLAFLKAGAKNSAREHGRRIGNASVTAIDILHRHGMLVVGGLIVGNPDDTAGAIAANLAFARKYVDWPYIQHPTPYPGTPMTRDFIERGLVVNQRVQEYDGTPAVTRSAHLEADEIEFMRWKAERWMKVRHMPRAIRHDPRFLLRNGRQMLAHTFRGTSWRSLLGLESARDVFRRYRAIRERERAYVDWPDPLSGSPAASP